MTKTAGRSVSLREVVDPHLQRDEFAREYISVALESGELSGLLIAIRRLVDARGGISELSNRTGLSRTQLYKTLSEEGNPRLGSLLTILKSYGIKLTVEPA